MRATRYLAQAVGPFLWIGLAWAQTAEPPARPQFLAAMGLLASAPYRVDAESLGRPVRSPFTLQLPASDEVRAVPDPEVEGALLGIEFLRDEGGFLESVIFTEAQVAPGPPEARAFAMANLLVLKSFPALQKAYPEARILGFGLVEIEGKRGVQLIGTFDGPGIGPVVFRHVGLFPGDGEQVIVALVTIATERMPVRGDEDLDNTFTGWTLRGLRFDPAPAP